MEAKLQEYPSRKPEGMQEVEFAEAMTRLVPLTPDHLCRRLYMQSLASTFSGDGVTDDTVPAKRLACILTFYHVISVYNNYVMARYECTYSNFHYHKVLHIHY